MPQENLAITDPPKDLDYDLWLGPAGEIPFIYSRTFFNFRWYDAFSGGILTDWGAHYCDTAQLVTGNEFSGPSEVTPVGESLYYNDGVFNTAYKFDLQYRYANNVTMRIMSEPQADASIRIEGDEGWVESKGWNMELAASDGRILEPAENKVVLPTGNDEFINFLESIRSGRKTIYSPESGHRTSSLLHIGNIALKLNRRVRWDPLNESFINDPEAEKFRKREMRDQWSYTRICPRYKY